MHELGRVLHLPGFKPGAVCRRAEASAVAEKSSARADIDAAVVCQNSIPRLPSADWPRSRTGLGGGGAVADPARPQTSSQLPLFSERKSGSITRMLATASST